eukprot:3313736-Rhodomonas_salina.2
MSVPGIAYQHTPGQYRMLHGERTGQKGRELGERVGEESWGRELGKRVGEESRGRESRGSEWRKEESWGIRPPFSLLPPSPPVHIAIPRKRLATYTRSVPDIA